MQNMRPLILANSLHGFTIHATDGALGRIDDFYFDDRAWNINHVVVDLGHWLPGRKVLLAPGLFGNADWRNKSIEVNATRKEIGSSPESRIDLSFARLADRARHLYLMHGAEIPGASRGSSLYIESASSAKAGGGEPRLRSMRSLKDGSIINESLAYVGKLADFLMDTRTWEIRFLFMKTLDDRVFLVEPDVVQSIDPDNRKITIRHPMAEKTEWQEYDSGHMAVMETEKI
jgi:hypothetical protein